MYLKNLNIALCGHGTGATNHVPSLTVQTSFVSSQWFLDVLENQDMIFFPLYNIKESLTKQNSKVQMT